MSAAQFRVRVTKDHLVFSAAHFLTFNGTICERLHGHNWRVAVEVAGALDENHYVFDFIALRDAVQQLVNQLDHRVLLPLQHPLISVVADETEVTARFAERRWVFPREDCILLPIPNTTAELIAAWLGSELKTSLATHPHSRELTSLRVEVEENFGQWGIVDLPLAEKIEDRR